MADDEMFLRRVYASTRAGELAITGWDEGQKEAFLRMQFDAQARSYQSEFPGASFQVILVDGAPAGRLYVDCTARGLHVVELALLPEFQGRGIGSCLLRQVMDEAGATGGTVMLSVEHSNRAARLYRRLGFIVVEDDGAYVKMEWRARPR